MLQQYRYLLYTLYCCFVMICGLFQFYIDLTTISIYVAVHCIMAILGIICLYKSSIRVYIMIPLSLMQMQWSMICAEGIAYFFVSSEISKFLRDLLGLIIILISIYYIVTRTDFMKSEILNRFSLIAIPVILLLYRVMGVSVCGIYTYIRSPLYIERALLIPIVPIIIVLFPFALDYLTSKKRLFITILFTCSTLIGCIITRNWFLCIFLVLVLVVSKANIKNNDYVSKAIIAMVFILFVLIKFLTLQQRQNRELLKFSSRILETVNEYSVLSVFVIGVMSIIFIRYILKYKNSSMLSVAAGVIVVLQILLHCLNYVLNWNVTVGFPFLSNTSFLNAACLILLIIRFEDKKSVEEY